MRTTPASPSSPQASPKKPQPSLRASLEEIEGAGDLEHGDEVTLTARGKVTELSTHNDYEGDGKTTTIVFELSSITVSEKHLTKAKEPEES